MTSPTPASANTVDAIETKIRLLELVNADRLAGGLSPLTLRPDLDEMATAHSQQMAQVGDIFHNEELLTSASKSRLGARTVGENVAYNSSIDDAHRRLMASPGHRANIMSSTFSALGLGLAGVNGTWYITEVFIQHTSAAGGPATTAAPVPPPLIPPLPQSPPAAEHPQAAPAATVTAGPPGTAPAAPTPRAAPAAGPAPPAGVAAPAHAPAPFEGPLEVVPEIADSAGAIGSADERANASSSVSFSALAAVIVAGLIPLLVLVPSAPRLTARRLSRPQL